MQDIFIVHGHDDATREEVANFIKEIGWRPIVLSERPNRGRTIIEKLENEAASARFAVVLLTPDDFGASANSTELNSRARQNVILEYGYFAGKLGRPHVLLLNKGNVEIPSDISGVAYTLFDDKGKWKQQLQREIDEIAKSPEVPSEPTPRKNMKIDQWRVTGTGGQADTLSKDAGDIKGEEWTIITPDPEGKGFYGPYITLEPNQYCATFHLKIEDVTESNERLATLDVTSQNSRLYFAKKTLTVGDFTQSNRYEAISLDFTVKIRDERFEFRLRTNPKFGARRQLTLDRVELWTR